MVGARCVVGYTYEGSCIPVCTGIANDVNIVDPRNCNRYYTCVGELPNTIPHECPESEYFDEMQGMCVPGSCSGSPCIPNCKFESSSFAYLAHRTDCTKYYLNDGVGQPVPLSCSPNTYFNGEECMSDPNECCDPCLVFCEKQYENVADPLDCTKFYHCRMDNYFPDEWDLYECNPGEYYSLFNRECTTDKSCTQLC